MQELLNFGFDDYFSSLWQQGDYDPYIPGRVAADYGSHLNVVTPKQYTAKVAGKLAHTSKPDELPKVGDWVALEASENGQATIHAVLPRRSEVSRKLAGGRIGKQVLAANIDVAFIVQALDDDFSPARLERYIYQLRQGNIKPVFIFNKADKVGDLAIKLDEVKNLDIDCIVTSAANGKGIEDVRKAIPVASTAVFLGSSGVGKSTLTNRLLGFDRQKTAEVRERDSTGKHTTSHRELFVLPDGGLIIDTPGIRELQLWGKQADLEESFPDIAELAEQCRFQTNCSHSSEPGCAVQQALKSGKLSVSRYENFQKLRAELQELETQTMMNAPRAKNRIELREEKTNRKYGRNYDEDEEE